MLHRLLAGPAHSSTPLYQTAQRGVCLLFSEWHARCGFSAPAVSPEGHGI